MATSQNQLDVIATSSGLTTATTPYTSGDMLGAALTFSISPATYAYVNGAEIVDLADITGAVDLYLFDRSVTFGTDNAAPSISDADQLFSRGKLSFPAPDDLGGSRMATLDSLLKQVRANGSNTIYGYLVTRSDHSFFGAATNIQVVLHTSLDV